MVRRVPILATAVVLVAVAIMVALGFWQLDRKAEKEALLARYEQARRMSAAVPWPSDPDAYPAALYRHSSIDCARVESIEPVSGRSSEGRAGWAQIAHCRLPDGSAAKVALGWSLQPEPVRWSGGEVGGIIGPAGKSGIRLVVAPAQAGLRALAAPDPSTLPNNHLSYAVQWFAFAATALVIYLLALQAKARRS